MVYTTGDTHSDFTRFTEEQFPIQAFLKQKSNNLLKYQQKLSKTIIFTKVEKTANHHS
jgi:hypothetical protein